MTKTTVCLASVLGMVISLAGCNYRYDKTPASDNPVSETGVRAFTASVYAYTRENCIGCHGKNQSPRFAQSDVIEAYRLSRLYVNFNNIPDSIFVIRTKNGHCGPACATDGFAMRNAIQKWWDEGEKQEEEKPPVSQSKTTDSIPIPSLTPANFVKMVWPLDRFGSEFAQSRFELEVQLFDSHTYRVRKPRLVTGKVALAIEGIQVLQNENLDPSANEYSRINNVIGSRSSVVLAAKNMLLSQLSKGGDTLAITFKKLSPGQAQRCRALPLFQEKVLPILSSSCARCHNDSGNDAFKTFPMNFEDAEMCGSALQRSDAISATDSAFIAFPAFQAGGHPVKALPLEDIASVTTWWQAEKKVANEKSQK